MQKFLLIFDKYFFWLVLFLMAFIPLYPKFPLLNVTGTFVAVRIEDFLIALILTLWGLRIILGKKVISTLSEGVNKTMLVFFFVGLVSLLSGILLTKTVSPSLALLHFLRRVELMMLVPVAASVLTKRKQVLILLIAGLLIAFLVDGYAFGQKYLDWPVISTGNSEFSKGLILKLSPEARVSSTFAGHYDLAVFMVMVLSIGSAIFFNLKKLYIRIASFLIFLVSIVVLVMTAARLSFVAVLVGIATSLLLTGKKWFILVMIIISIAILAYPSQLRERLIATVSVSILQEGDRYVSPNADQQQESRINIPTLLIQTSSTSGLRHDSTDSASTPESTISAQISDIVPGEPTNITDLAVYRSYGIRFNQEWPRAIRAFEKNPLLGTGYSSLGLATDNDFLRSLGEVGILGTIAFSLVIIEIMKKIWISYRKINDKLIKFVAAGLLAMMIAFVANGIFIDVFEASKVATLFWLFCGFGIALRNFNENT
ncbi:MAG: hypothetical protein WCV81_02080 [Microgenomates group bacterium]|jgi:hypothetical protein